MKFQQIDAAREEQKRLSLGAVAERAGIGTSGFESFRPNEKISELAKTEGDLQRERDDKMFNVFSEMQKLVAGIAEKVEESLTRPVLKPA